MSVSLIIICSLVAVKNNAGAIVAVWAPIIVVSFDYNIYNSSFDGHSLEVWPGHKLILNYYSIRINQQSKTEKKNPNPS